MSLKEWQQKVSDAIINNSDTKNISYPERLSIYRHGFYIRLHEALKKDFPVLCQIMGEKKFSLLIIEYLVAYPPKHFSITSIGSCLPKYLTEISYPRHLCEISELEWRLSEIQSVEDADLLTIEHLSEYDPSEWPSITFALAPSVCFIDCNVDIVKLYHDPKSKALHLKNSIIVWRQAGVSCFRRIEDREGMLFKMLIEQKVFGEICELVNNDDWSIQDLINTLTYWIRKDIFIKL